MGLRQIYSVAIAEPRKRESENWRDSHEPHGFNNVEEPTEFAKITQDYSDQKQGKDCVDPNPCKREPQTQPKRP